jgi:hypothetical protein
VPSKPSPPGAEAGSHERSAGCLGKARVPAATVLTVHEQRVIDGRGMVCQLMVGVEAASSALDVERVVEPDAVGGWMRMRSLLAIDELGKPVKELRFVEVVDVIYVPEA